MHPHGFLLASLLLATACTFSTPVKQPTASVLQETTKAPSPVTGIIKEEPVQRIAPLPLVIIGEGGTSGYLFQFAADTYVKEHGGERYTVHDGDEFIAAMKNFQTQHGAITSFVYFGHGNEVGLYVNQAPHINGALYANDPALNEKFRAGSIYDLPHTIFASGSTSLFFGCNLAREYAGLDPFAEQFANHFRTTVKAAIGPTEFSFKKDGKTFTKMPASTITEPLYMVPTSETKGFMSIPPSPAGSGGYVDVYDSMEAADAIRELSKRGLRLGSDHEFHPYQSITTADAKEFCKVIDPEAECSTEEFRDTELFRNTAALKLLLDAVHAPVKKTKVPYEGEIYFASQHNLLTHNFTHKRWYSRGEMAMLTWEVFRIKKK